MTSRSHDSRRGHAWCPGLLCGRRTLSGSPRPDAQVLHTAGTAAPSVRVSHQQGAHRNTSAGSEKRKKKTWTTGRHGKKSCTTGRSLEPRVRSALYSAGLHPSQCGAPPVAPPRSRLHLLSRRFEKPLERGRALTPTASRRASTNRERAAPPLPFTPSAGKIQAGKRRAPSRSFLLPSSRSRTVSDAETVVAWSVEDGVRKRA